MAYFVYMLLCEDGSYYTGITNDLVKRFRAHTQGLGASYTRSHRPVKIVYQESLPDKSSALKREHIVKQLTHAEKQLLCKAYVPQS